MAVQGVRVTVGTSATLLSVADSDGTFGSSLLVKNPSSGVTVDLGGSDVSSGAGLELEAGDALPIDLDSGEALYGSVAAGTQEVQVLRRGV